MSEELLQMLNPGNRFDRRGDKIAAANVTTNGHSEKASRVEVDKRSGMLNCSARVTSFWESTPSRSAVRKAPVVD
jgi:hypothetical protein